MSALSYLAPKSIDINFIVRVPLIDLFVPSMGHSVTNHGDYWLGGSEQGCCQHYQQQ